MDCGIQGCTKHCCMLPRAGACSTGDTVRLAFIMHIKSASRLFKRDPPDQKLLKSRKLNVLPVVVSFFEFVFGLTVAVGPK